MIHAVGSFDLDVVVVGEQCVEPRGLSAGEERGTGVQGAAGAVQRVTGPAPMPMDRLLVLCVSVSADAGVFAGDDGVWLGWI